MFLRFFCFSLLFFWGDRPVIRLLLGGCFACLVEADMYLFPEKLLVSMCVMRDMFVSMFFAGKIRVYDLSKRLFFYQKNSFCGRGSKNKVVY